MNERIKELAGQAREYARDYVAECKHYGYYSYYMEHNELEVKFEEKFSELIVRECAEVAWEHWLEDQDSSAEAPILKHFNVLSE